MLSQTQEISNRRVITPIFDDRSNNCKYYMRGHICGVVREGGSVFMFICYLLWGFVSLLFTALLIYQYDPARPRVVGKFWKYLFVFRIIFGLSGAIDSFLLLQNKKASSKVIVSYCLIGFMNTLYFFFFDKKSEWVPYFEIVLIVIYAFCICSSSQRDQGLSPGIVIISIINLYIELTFLLVSFKNINVFDTWVMPVLPTLTISVLVFLITASMCPSAKLIPKSLCNNEAYSSIYDYSVVDCLCWVTCFHC